MAFMNNMGDLVNKIERRLGTKPLNLPDDITKDKWADVIINDSLVTFSRYFPRQWNYAIDPKTHPKKDGYYIIDEDNIGKGVKILGIRDLSFQDFTQDSLTYQQNMGLGIYDFVANGFGVNDVPLAQMRADHMSLFNNGIYPVFEPPNKIRLESVTSRDVSTGLGRFHILLFITHRPDLTTIMPTQMDIFESLAQADVATFLYNFLIHYDGLETVYTQIDLKLQTIETEAGKREEVMNTIKESYVSAANQNQPMIICV